MMNSTTINTNNKETPVVEDGEDLSDFDVPVRVGESAGDAWQDECAADPESGVDAVFSKEPKRLNCLKALLLKKRYCLALFCCVLILCLVVVGVVLSVASDGSSSASASVSEVTPADPTVVPQAEPLDATTGTVVPQTETEPVTTAAPVISPTSAPVETATVPTTTTSTTQYPTAEPVEFPEWLPTYTHAELEDPTSPQSRAMLWFDSVPGHLEYLPDWRKEQLFALVAFYYSYSGDEWYENENCNWLDHTVPECEWRDWGNKATDCDEDGRITAISLQSEPMGPFAIVVDEAVTPPELALLDSMERVQVVNLALNAALVNVLPPRLGALSNLKDVRLTGDSLRGTIPTYLGGSASFQKLTNLGLQTNQLTGQVPSELGLLTSLKHLILRENFLIGTVPSELGNLSELESLVIQENNLTGTLPTSICQLPLLNALKVDCLKITCPDECDCLCQDM